MSASDASLEMAVIGNCQVAALIDEQATIVWWCVPRPDGDPVFCALLKKEGARSESGLFAIELRNFSHSEQRYRHNTAVVETLLYDKSGGSVRVIDFCPRFRNRGRIFRPMSIIRIVEPAGGRPVVNIRLRPDVNYGARAERGGFGSHHLRFAAADVCYRVTTDASLSNLQDSRPQVLERPLSFVLGPDETIEESVQGMARSFLEQTCSYWHDWVRSLSVPFDWQAAVIRAAITLKLCTFEDTGAVLAALTTSIPESPGSQRNWDYRYCWLRDSFFTVQALNRLGVTRTMEGYLHYLDNIVAATQLDELQPVYGICGETQFDERQIDSLQGYRGMGPVRTGNQAASQVQLDVYGAVILAATQLFFDERLVSAGDPGLFDRLERLGARALQSYDQPDAGPWERRKSQSPHTFSAAISWAGCDRLARIARRLERENKAREWRGHADKVREDILARAWSKRRKCFTATLDDGDQLDATTLLLPSLGLLPASDPRFASTVDVIGRELAKGELVYRYKHKDDFGRPESAFAVCGFWHVNALVDVGREEEARDLYERLLARRTRLGLLSEDIHPGSGELWGNFPQTYSMVGIISSALRLSRSWERAL